MKYKKQFTSTQTRCLFRNLYLLLDINIPLKHQQEIFTSVKHEWISKQTKSVQKQPKIKKIKILYRHP